MHERLHAHPSFAALLSGGLGTAGYRRLLLRLYGFHKPLQDALVQAAESRGGMSRVRRRADNLVEDLEALGCGRPTIAGCPMAQMPPITSLGHLLGCLYVREGATLGGRVLARKLEPLLGPGTRGRRFFAGTDEDAELWRETCAAIESAAADGHLADMIDGACTTFALFEDWISGGETARSTGDLP